MSLDELKSYSTTPIELEIDDVFGTFGFKDKDGNVVIEPQYASVGEFAHGLCPVCLCRTWFRTPEGRRYYETHWGYIDTLGKMAIPAKFREAWSFNKYGLAVVTDDYTSAPYLIDTEGNKIENALFPYISHYYDYGDRFFVFSHNANWGNSIEDEAESGLYDTKERKIMFPPIASDFIELDEECIIVYEPGEFGPGDFHQRYINSKGENLYPWQVGKGFSIVERPNARGLSIVAKFQFVEITAQKCSGYFPWKGKKYNRVARYGVLDSKGELVIPMEYDSIKEQGEKTFICKKGESTYVIEL